MILWPKYYTTLFACYNNTTIKHTFIAVEYGYNTKGDMMYGKYIYNAWFGDITRPESLSIYECIILLSAYCNNITIKHTINYNFIKIQRKGKAIIYPSNKHYTVVCLLQN